jgi:hypothetical protein
VSLSAGFRSKVLNWPIRAIWLVFRILLVAWAALAIFYSNLPSAALRLALAVAFAMLAIWLLWLSRDRRAPIGFMVLFLGVLAWWLSISPSHDRPWRPEVAVMPRATIDGDHVRITGVRNFEYRSRNDFTARYEEREIQLSHLTAVDFFVSYWSEGPVAHTFVSFVFDNAPPLSISIETRPEVGEGFDPVGSMFKKFELIYVVGDERDLVRVRRTARQWAPAADGLSETDQRTRRSARVLSSAGQQLHDQHHTLLECRRPQRPVRHSSCA